MRALPLIVIALFACGPKSGTKDSGPSCEEAVANLAKVMTKWTESHHEEQRQNCRSHPWSAEARACHAAATTVSAVADCYYDEANRAEQRR